MILRGAMAAVAILAFGAGPGHALTPVFPAPATTTLARSVPLGTYKLPLGPWSGGAVPTRLIEGPRSDAAWRLPGGTLSTLQLLAPLREQLADEGYRILWECETETCGGFDFRFAIDVLDEPEMHVDLGDFRFLAAERDGPAGAEAVSLLVSRSSQAGFVQMVTIGGSAPAVPVAEPAPGEATPPGDGPLAPSGSVASRLEQDGAAPLDDLVFASGSAVLGEGPFRSLDELTAYLRAHPDQAVALVGHTDASGNLATNIALSTARAASVRDRLIRVYGIPKGQVSAEGVGYLAPRASNRTEEGRAQNRRVEAVITSTP